MSEIQLGSDGKYFAFYNGKRIASTSKAYMVKKLAGGYDTNQRTVTTQVSTPVKESKYDINKRFSFVEKLVKMVATSVQPSVIITGSGGLGKSYTVTKTLEASGYSNISESESFVIHPGKKCFRVVKGYSTPKGLYRTLYENNNGVIVFDDTDAILRDPIALNLLKAALDSYSERYITWNADMREDDLPRSFKFQGRVIFISNMAEEKIDQAVRSRSMAIDLSMTRMEIVKRMEYIASLPEFMPEYSAKQKSEAVEFIAENAETAKELNLRTLISVVKIRANNTDWKELADYVLS